MSKMEQTKSVTFFTLFRYASPRDYLLIMLSVIACLVKALVDPITLIILGEMVAMLVDRNLGVGISSKTHLLPLFGGGKTLINATKEENMAELRNDSWSFGINMCICAVLMFLSGVVYVDLMNIAGLRMIVKMRQKFFEATLRKDIGWHDIASNQNFAVRITDNMEKIREGVSEKFGHIITLCMSVIVTISISFAYGWKLTLAISAYIPIVVICNYIVAKVQSKLTICEQDCYVNAGSLVEEIVSAVRTVVAFGGEKLETDRYDELLIPARNASKKKGVISGVGDAVTKSMLFFSIAAAFWYGVHLILNDRSQADHQEYTPAVLTIVFFGILVGAAHIGRCSPFLDAFSMAKGSAVPIFEIIDSTTKIDPMSSEGETPKGSVVGNIEFQEVFFKYPSREDIIVLRGFNLKVTAGQTVALVGHSGCGKSTCLQLLQRFYDPAFGNVIVDDVNIRKYNVSWLRSNIAVVGQEPVLFQGTIGENIKHGNTNATEKEIEEASKAAGAHEFIKELPQGYDTSISEKGIQLSGGQKQRIAIARALIQNPKILLLDEATSALDYNSEKLVQKALNAASRGRTTIVVSHRLSAIKDADRIVFIHDGKAVEEGSHEELMKLRGKYFDMVTAHDGDKDEVNEDDELNKVKSDSKNDPKRKISSKLLGKVSFSDNLIQKDIDTDESAEQHTPYLKTFLDILKIARPEWKILIFGTICAVLYGCSQPAYAFIFGEFLGSLAEPDPEETIRRTAVLCFIAVFAGLATGAACFIQTYLFNLAGVWLTTRLRSNTFKAILSQEVGWFDEEQNSVGALSARLSGDASTVQGAIGYPLSGIIQAVSNFLCCASIAFYYSWQMALACLCTAPFMVGAVVFEARLMSKSAVAEKRILEETSRIATEAIANVRTVAGLRREPQLIEEYNKELVKYESQLRKRLKFRGAVNSSGWSILFLGYAIGFTIGGILCSEGKIEFQNIIKVSESLLYGLMVLALALAFTPSFTSALIAGHRLFQIMERKPRIKSSPCYDNNLQTNKTPQGVTYQDVNFHYPTRPDVQVLKGLDLSIFQGKTVALVGSSGCGKSTCVQLLLRYYDPNSGRISLDNKDIQRDLTLTTLRRRIGIVSQEPVLFEKTIAENIAYGDNSRKVPMSEIIEASNMANAHSFITTLPSGFETKLGSRGTQLSGGQKQRIAIARALVRNPQVLLLDEATSALDLQSEKIVQSALDTACSGRTCIVVAHRLTTIHNADLICVLQDGRIAEQGNHSQLLAIDGIYAKLYRSQPDTS